MTRAKICGVTRRADLEAAVAAGADALGFTVDVAVETPRELPAGEATDLVASVPPFVATVLVTMPDDAEGAATLRDRVGTDAIQLHGCEPGTVAAVADAVDATTIAAVDPRSEVDAYADAADALLVDSVDERGGGGTGETHDWERTRDLVADLSVPVVLAGGLTPDNVAAAVRTVGPYAVDVASGVEERGGIKDHEAVAAFLDRARGAVVRV